MYKLPYKQKWKKTLVIRQFKKLYELWITIYRDYYAPTLTKCTTITLTLELLYAPINCASAEPFNRVTWKMCISIKTEYFLHLKAYKANPFREGVDIHVLSSGASVCPVISLDRYVEFRNKTFERNNDKKWFFVMEILNSPQRRKPKYAITHVASKSILVYGVKYVRLNRWQISRSKRK
jgi:hypothetical protein